MNKDRIYITSTAYLHKGGIISDEHLRSLGLPYEEEFVGSLRDVVIALSGVIEIIVRMKDDIFFIEIYNDYR